MEIEWLYALKYQKKPKIMFRNRAWTKNKNKEQKTTLSRNSDGSSYGLGGEIMQTFLQQITHKHTFLFVTRILQWKILLTRRRQSGWTSWFSLTVFNWGVLSFFKPDVSLQPTYRETVRDGSRGREYLCIFLPSNLELQCWSWKGCNHTHGIESSQYSQLK